MATFSQTKFSAAQKSVFGLQPTKRIIPKSAVKSAVAKSPVKKAPPKKKPVPKKKPTPYTKYKYPNA